MTRKLQRHLTWLEAFVAAVETGSLEGAAQHLGVARADDDMHRLTFSIAALVMQMWTQHDVLHAVAPRLTRPQALSAWAQRLTGYALAMVHSEAERRRALASPAPSSRKAPPHA